MLIHSWTNLSEEQLLNEIEVSALNGIVTIVKTVSSTLCIIPSVAALSMLLKMSISILLKFYGEKASPIMQFYNLKGFPYNPKFCLNHFMSLPGSLMKSAMTLKYLLCHEIDSISSLSIHQHQNLSWLLEQGFSNQLFLSMSHFTSILESLTLSPLQGVYFSLKGPLYGMGSSTKFHFQYGNWNSKCFASSQIITRSGCVSASLSYSF